MVTYNTQTKFELNKMHHIDNHTLIEMSIMYKNYFFDSCEKTIHDTLTKMNRIHLKETNHAHTKFELNRLHHLSTRILLIV